MRQIIHKAAPQATEAIKYGMPTFILGKNLVHFAGNLNHIGFYPTPGPIEHFAAALKPYVTSKGAIQFPIDQPLPERLIHDIVLFRVKACAEKTPLKPTTKQTEPFATLAAPARRALESMQIKTLKKLASQKEETIKNLHGMGPNALKKLKELLAAENLSFKA